MLLSTLPRSTASRLCLARLRLLSLDPFSFINALSQSQFIDQNILKLPQIPTLSSTISTSFHCSRRRAMPSHILPVTSHHQSSKKTTSSVDPETTMFMNGAEKTFLDDPTARFLLSSSTAPSSPDETIISFKPILSRTSSFSGAIVPPALSVSSPPGSGSRYQKRRRRTASENSLSSITSVANGERQPLRENDDVSHDVPDTFLVTRLSLKLLGYIGVGYRWIMRFLALGCYSMMLLPGFVQIGYYYYSSKFVLRDIVYGDQPRNKLDLYLPKNSDGSKPVIAFVTGGAWIIGYKAWGSLLGKQLSERDIIVACIDYRNFPQGTMSDMVKDASQGISFVCNNIAQYGGDPNRIYLMGQSAGAHIAACALVEQAIKETVEGESTTWSVSQIKAYFGLSGAYNLFNLVDYFHSRGLYKSIFLGIMEGEESLRRFSPEVIVQDPEYRNAVSTLPPVVLFHGTADYSIPADASTSFADTLQRVGVRAESILYEGKTHTDVFVQDPMRGGSDQMFEDLVAVIHADDIEAQAKDVAASPRRRLVPEFMIQVARRVSPF